MAVNPSAFGPKPFFVNAAGEPLVGGKLFTYLGGSTSTKVNTFTDATGSVADVNPIILNALGQTPNGYFWTQGQAQKVVLAPSTDTDPPTTPIFTVDNLYGINDPINAPANSEWVTFAGAPTFVNATSFTLAGNQTATFQIGRRVRTTNTAGTIYSTITASAFTTLTTVTVVNDSGVLDTGLSAVSYGLLASADPSLPNSVAVRGTMGIAASAIQPITASVAANALTFSLNPTVLDFRSATLGSGTVNLRTISSAISLTISSGSTMGTANTVSARIAVIALDNAGTVELAAVNLAGGNNLDETTLISTTAEGGAGGADSANTIYSTTARASVPFRVVGFVDITEATAGTWATAPSTIQGYGGQALAALQSIGYSQTWQLLTGSRAINTTYTNTTGRPIEVAVSIFGTVAASTIGISFTVAGVTGINEHSLIASTPASNTTINSSVIVPPGASYAASVTQGSLGRWHELRS